MSFECYIGKLKIDWTSATLEEYTKVYCPPGWEEVFDAAQDDVFR